MRKNPNVGLEQFTFMTKLPPGDALLVHTFVGEHLYTHDEFQKYLKSLGVSTKITA